MCVCVYVNSRNVKLIKNLILKLKILQVRNLYRKNVKNKKKIRHI